MTPFSDLGVFIAARTTTPTNLWVLQTVSRADGLGTSRLWESKTILGRDADIHAEALETRRSGALLSRGILATGTERGRSRRPEPASWVPLCGNHHVITNCMARSRPADQDGRTKGGRWVVMRAKSGILLPSTLT